MRKPALLALFAVTLAPFASAQHVVKVDDGAAADFRTRCGLSWSNPGWAFTRYAFDKQGNGIGPSGISAMDFTMTDEDCSTAESSQFALFEQDLSLPPGSPGTLPDANRVLAMTAVFNSNTGGANVCTWLRTVTFPSPVTGVRDSDLFVGAFLDAGLGWNGDGPSGQSSSIGGNTPEFPNAAPGSPARDEIDREYSFFMLGGTGPTLTAGSENWMAGNQILFNRISYVHHTRVGVRDNTGLFSSIGARSPTNLGWAADYPDLDNRGAHLTPRADELLWRGRHDTLHGASVVGTILLSTTLARDLVGVPLDFGWGILELMPSDDLFRVTIGGGIPGLVAPGVSLNQAYDLPPALLPPSIRRLLHEQEVDLYAQELRADLATGAFSLGSLDSHSFRK